MRMTTAIHLSGNGTKEIVSLLNSLLDAEYALYNMTRRVYWNSKGPGYSNLRAFIKSHIRTIDVIIETLSEQIRSFGHFALGSLDEFLRITHIDEEHEDFDNSTEITQILALEHDTIIRTIQSEISPVLHDLNATETAYLINELVYLHEKMAFLLRTISS